MDIPRKVHHITPRYLTCAICCEPLDLKTAKSNDDGFGVHEECYVQKMVRQPAPTRSWKEIAIEVVGEKDPRRFQELVEELDEALIAQVHDSKWQGHPAKNNPYLLPKIRQRTEYGKIVDSAVLLMRSDYASLQMLFPERGTGGELRLLAFRGFNPEAARFWEWVRADSKSTCGMALRDAKRVVAPDIAACDFMADSEDRQVYLDTGIHACQTTPLIARAGNLVGMISTHWRTPHQPSKSDFQAFDCLAMEAADLIERCKRDGGL